MKSKSGICAVFLICFATNPHLVAQPERIVSRQYTMKDGLSDDNVLGIFQDSKGFLWVSTESGLNKFDGYKFTKGYLDPSLAHGPSRVLWEDHQKRLWIAHSEGIYLYDLQTEKIFSFPDSVNKEKPLIVQVIRLRERSDGKVWMCSDEGIFLADPLTLSIKRFKQFPTSYYTDVIETTDGSLWVSSHSHLIHIDGISGNTALYKAEKVDPKTGHINSYFTLNKDGKDRLWIGTEFGFDLFNSLDKSFVRYFHGVSIFEILENGDGKLWVATSMGLYLFDPETGKYGQITDSWTTTVKKDRQGIIWVGTLEGLLQLDPKTKKFSVHDEFGLLIGAIVEDGNKDILMIVSTSHSLYNSRLFRFDPSLKNIHEFKNDPSNPLSFSGNFLRTIFRDADGSLLFVGQTQEIERYDPRNKSFSHTFLPFQSDPLKDPLNAFKDSQGNVWLGGWFYVDKYDPVKRKYEHINGLPRLTIYGFFEDRYQNLWIGSTGGLIRYKLKTGALDIFKNISSDPQSLSNNIVFHVMMDSEKNIWIGTGGGLNKMIKGTENDIPKFVRWTTGQSGLPHDDVYCIVEGGDGTLWIACGNMISHFSPQSNTFQNYDHSDGLTGRHFKGAYSQNAKGLRSSYGNIFFGSSNGLVIFHPDSLQNNTFLPPVIITDFSIDNQPAPVKGTYADTLAWQTPLQQSLTYAKELALRYYQNDFNIEFTALNFINQENNHYKYKLEPYETEWIEASSDNRFARYTNISPGTYTFRVIGSNNDGVWNEEGATLVITISPPWWHTLWAYGFYALAFVAIVAVWRSYENRRLSLKHQAEYLMELDNLKTRFFANISHEFRTPITLILGPLKDLYNKTNNHDQKTVIGTMMRNGQRLLRLINQLLELSKIEAGKMKLQTHQTDLVQFLKEIASSYESLATDKKIKFFFYPEMQELMTYIDTEKIERVFHNILSNAFKFTKEGGEVILYLKVEDKSCSD